MGGNTTLAPVHPTATTTAAIAATIVSSGHSLQGVQQPCDVIAEGAQAPPPGPRTVARWGRHGRALRPLVAKH